MLLREIIRALKKKHRSSPDAVAITASTGIAACNIGGITLHSFSGAGLALEKAEALANKIKKQKKAASRWLRTKVLIIDESMWILGMWMWDGVLTKWDTRSFYGRCRPV